jgi:hypothetical protein
VHLLRRLVLSRHRLAIAILALALLMKLVVPAGFMPILSNGQIVVSLCSGTGPTKMVMIVPVLGHKPDGGGEHSGKAEQPCAFAGLSMSLLAAADPILLAAAILFVLALGMRPLLLLTATAPPYLRPPLRGPPAHI